jgi:aspartate 1-decarboxylase
MKREFMTGKVHRATVTKADLDYEGSLGLDEDLMKAADLHPYQRVDVYNVTTGARFATYLVKAEKGSGTVAIYGAAAHLARKGDKVIIAAYSLLDDDELEFFTPRVVLVDGNNRIKDPKPLS